MVRAMVLPLAVALVMMTQLGAVRGAIGDDTVTLAPTTLSQGATLTVTFPEHDSALDFYLMYKSATTGATIGVLTCDGTAGSSSTIAAGTSDGTNGTETASQTTNASISLTWTESTQVVIRAKVCGVGGGAGVDNAQVVLTNIISVAVTPTTLAQGATLTATYTNWATGAAWICYSSGTAAVASSPACAAAGNATTVTAAGSGTAVACTASTTTGAAVTLTWTESAQDNIRVRACTSASDTAQANNANVALTVAAAAGNGTATTGTATTLTGVAKTQVTQDVTITSVTSTEYNNATSTNMKMTYQCAYLNMISSAATPPATWCTATVGSIVWDSRIGITSTAAANARRAGSKITFTTAVATTLATSTVLSAAATVAGTNFAANLVTQLGNVNTATQYGIAVPLAAAITAGPVTYAYYDASGTQTSSASAIMPSLLTGMVALSAMLAM